MSGSAVQITNNGTEPVQGRFNGVDYDFDPGVPVIVSHQAASHIFAYGLPDKTSAFARLGWMQHTGMQKEANRRMAEFKFEEVVARFSSQPVSDASPLAAGQEEGEGLDASSPDSALDLTDDGLDDDGDGPGVL